MAKKKKPEETIDLSKPIDLSKIGTPDDPCFGTQYDPRDKAVSYTHLTLPTKLEV